VENATGCVSGLSFDDAAILLPFVLVMVCGVAL
jgi:hypothetical protein